MGISRGIECMSISQRVLQNNLSRVCTLFISKYLSRAYMYFIGVQTANAPKVHNQQIIESVN